MKFETTKFCIRCDAKKKLSQFHKNPHMVDGHVNVCISCKLKLAHERHKAPSDLAVMMNQWAKNTVRARQSAAERFFSRRAI